MNGKSCSFLKRCPLVFEMVKGRCFLLNKGKEEKQESYIINHISKLVISPRLRHIYMLSYCSSQEIYNV